MRKLEQDRWDSAAWDIEIFAIDNVLVLPPVLYLSSFAAQGVQPVYAYALWVVAVIIWTPWIVLRVDRGPEPLDTARATAWLGVGLLSWPASWLVMALVAEDVRFYIGFPIVFLSSATAMLLAGLTPPYRPSAGRSRLLLAGGASYAITALACGACALLSIGVAGGGVGWVIGLLLLGAALATGFAAVSVFRSAGVEIE